VNHDGNPFCGEVVYEKSNPAIITLFYANSNPPGEFSLANPDLIHTHRQHGVESGEII
jgi:hypothetical protein